MKDFAKEDRKMQDHIFRPGIKVDREHGAIYRMNENERAAMDAKKFEATVQAQLRDLFATV